MAANRIDAAKSNGEAATDAAKSAAEKDAAVVAGGSGGIRAWLPLLANIILMPALAYVTTTYLLLPKLRGGAAATAVVSEKSASEGGEHGSGGGKEDGPKSKVTVPLAAKVLVNVSGTMGARYLIANISLVGIGPEFRPKVESNDPQLRDVAASTLAGKTISDLEMPGARNVIRNELISVFNNILGNGMVKEIYLTEFAIQ